jgi:hypothetical protein
MIVKRWYFNTRSLQNAIKLIAQALLYSLKQSDVIKTKGSKLSQKRYSGIHFCLHEGATHFVTSQFKAAMREYLDL